MDEPDEGLDIYRLKELCSLLEMMVDDAPRSCIQPVVAIHNVAIIKRLLKKGGVNFIELTPGYLDAVASLI